MPRQIVHIDCDSFYASIEIRDNPALAELPVAVGGAPERRGVVATCNYLARRYGVHSAMASATARRLCPDLVIIRPALARYRQVSQQIQAIFQDYTNTIEPLSLDEAYLDLTDTTRSIANAVEIAERIRGRISREIGITVSAGIAPNKFLAKIASDWNKPDGQFVVEPDQVDSFVRELPVNKLHGVGKVTAAKLQRLGITTCGELRSLDPERLDRQFGSFGRRLHELANGIDHRPVQTSRIRKSVSVENTFASDLADLQACEEALPPLLEQLNQRMQGLTGSYRVSKQVVKIKFNDFVSTTVETVSDQISSCVFRMLLKEGYLRGNRPVRLLGVGARLSPKTVGCQPDRNLSHLQGPAGNVETTSEEVQLALFMD